jgi:alpha-tubulin suppressor-like RCC1 family protein
VDISVSIALPAGVRQITAGDDYTSAALLANGTVATWGSNEKGEIGDGTTTERDSPVVVPGMTGVIQVATGAGFSLALRSDGTVWAWGYIHNGELASAFQAGGGYTGLRCGEVPCL